MKINSKILLVVQNRGIPIWPLAALSPAFHSRKIFFFGALYYASAIIGLS